MRICTLKNDIRSLPRWAKIILVALALAGVAWFDKATPAYINATGLYLIPLFLSAWYCGIIPTFFFTIIAIAVDLSEAQKLVPNSAQPWELAVSLTSVAAVLIAFSAQMLYLRYTFSRLQRENHTDSLTGVRSRRSFISAIQAEMARALRYRQPFVIGLLDLDNFKRINDSKGHQTGDEALRKVAICMQRRLRDVDIIGRLGGDEFAILLPGTQLDNAHIAISRLHIELTEILHTFDLHAGVSTGLGQIPYDCSMSTEDLLAEIDTLMYSVKHGTKGGIAAALIASSRETNRTVF